VIQCLQQVWKSSDGAPLEPNSGLMSSIGEAQSQLDYFKNTGPLVQYHTALLAAVIQYYVVMLFISRGSQEYQIVASPFKVFKMTDDVIYWAKNSYFRVGRDYWMGEVILSAFINQVGTTWSYEERESAAPDYAAYNLLVGGTTTFGLSRRALLDLKKTGTEAPYPP
jgi:hypothetical protein